MLTRMKRGTLNDKCMKELKQFSGATAIAVFSDHWLDTASLLEVMIVLENLAVFS